MLYLSVSRLAVLALVSGLIFASISSVRAERPDDLTALLEPDKSAEAPETASDPGPQIRFLEPDQEGGIWILATDNDARTFLRLCDGARGTPCTPWSAVDQGWTQRHEENQNPTGSD